MRLKRSFLFLIILSLSPAFGKNLGRYGQVFDIAELSLLEMIQSRLTKLKEEGKLERLQKELQQKAVAQIERPAAVAEIQEAKVYRKRIYDPSFEASQDIKDHQGKILIKKGTRQNPLDTLSFGQPLLFVNGDDKEQVEWSLRQTGKIVLIKGAPLELSRAHHRPFYFDQGAVLTEKLDITEVPTRVSQEDKHLSIESLPMVKGEKAK